MITPLPCRDCGTVTALVYVVTTTGNRYCRACWDDREAGDEPQRDEAPRRGRRTA